MNSNSPLHLLNRYSRLPMWKMPALRLTFQVLLCFFTFSNSAIRKLGSSASSSAAPAGWEGRRARARRRLVAAAWRAGARPGGDRGDGRPWCWGGRRRAALGALAAQVGPTHRSARLRLLGRPPAAARRHPCRPVPSCSQRSSGPAAAARQRSRPPAPRAAHPRRCWRAPRPPRPPPRPRRRRRGRPAAGCLQSPQTRQSQRPRRRPCTRPRAPAWRACPCCPAPGPASRPASSPASAPARWAPAPARWGLARPCGAEGWGAARGWGWGWGWGGGRGWAAGLEHGAPCGRVRHSSTPPPRWAAPAGRAPGVGARRCDWPVGAPGPPAPRCAGAARRARGIGAGAPLAIGEVQRGRPRAPAAHPSSVLSTPVSCSRCSHRCRSSLMTDLRRRVAGLRSRAARGAWPRRRAPGSAPLTPRRLPRRTPASSWPARRR
jgi:hypothetical protein